MDDVKNKTNIEDLAFLNARIFIGNLPSDKVTKDEIENLFQVYGKILGVSIHARGFGFVQFEKESNARRAQQAENGSKLIGQVLDVKMAAEGRQGTGGHGGAGRWHGGDFGRDNQDRGLGRGHDDYDRDQKGYYPQDGQGPPPPMLRRERSLIRGELFGDRFRDPYPRRELPPPRVDPYRREPMDDLYRDLYGDDHFRRDPYRKDPYHDPYRGIYREPYQDPFLLPLPPKKPIPADIQIICMSKQLMLYGEAIESRLRQHAMICDLVIIPKDMTVPQMVEEAARQKCLFAIIISSQNEVLKSLTLNILHGIPQEHRNMPLEDAVKLVATSFEKYIQTQREKVISSLVAPVVSPSAATSLPHFLPPSSDISYLLNLLADNRQLTYEELEKVIGYLSDRKNKLIIAEGRRPLPTESASRQAAMGAPAVSAGDPTSLYLVQRRQELQKQILNLVTTTSLSNSGSTQAPAVQPVQPQVPDHQGGYSSFDGVPQTQASQGEANSMINFGNPNVKNALDNLIQSGPNLLKNLPTTGKQSAAAIPSLFQVAAQHGAHKPRQVAYPQQQHQGAQQDVQAGYGKAQYSKFQHEVPVQRQAAPRGAYGASQPQRSMLSGSRIPLQAVRPHY